jgi:hypothetical protein
VRRLRELPGERDRLIRLGLEMGIEPRRLADVVEVKVQRIYQIRDEGS